MERLYHSKRCEYFNEGTLTMMLSVQDVPVILKYNDLQCLGKALDYL